MEYICKKAKEQLILEPEDYPGDEWTTILKIFGMEEAERIVISDYKFEAYGKVPTQIMRRSGRYPWGCDHDPLPFVDPEQPELLKGEEIWESEDESVIEEVLEDDKVIKAKAPHWIIDEHGFGGTYYQCSNCGAMHWDILKDVDTSGPCPYCNAPLHEGETVYMKDGKVEVK